MKSLLLIKKHQIFTGFSQFSRSFHVNRHFNNFSDHFVKFSGEKCYPKLENMGKMLNRWALRLEHADVQLMTESVNWTSSRNELVECVKLLLEVRRLETRRRFSWIFENVELLKLICDFDVR